MTDRSRDVSFALTEVRTVLSRAETALDALLWNSYQGNLQKYEWVRFEGKPSPAGGEYVLIDELQEPGDPDAEAMYYAMERVVHELARWRKAGKKKRR